MAEKTDKKTLFIIDGSACFYRAFHAIPRFTNRAGFPTNAIYGFTQTLRKLLRDYSPDYICVAYDSKGPTHRHEKYGDYKSERPPMPDDLAAQLPYLKRVVEALNIKGIEKPGYEADDIIAEAVRLANLSGLKSVIVSGDKDLYQLVDDDTVVLDYTNDKEFDRKGVLEKFGLGPEAIADFLALAGDSSDSIPGVPGIGPKTALKLLNEFKTLDGVYENLEKVKGDKLKESLKKHEPQARLSKELATLHTGFDVAIMIEDFKSREPDSEVLGPLLKELDFVKLYREIIEIEKKHDTRYEILGTPSAVAEAVGKLSGSERVSFYLDAPVGGSDGESACAYLAMVTGDDFKCCIKLPQNEATLADLISPLRPVLSDRSVAKATDDSKALYLYFLRRGVEVKGIVMDTSLASYLLNPAEASHSLDGVAFAYLGITLSVDSEAGATGRGLLVEADSARRMAMAIERAVVVSELSNLFDKKLVEENLARLLTDMELPLSEVLARMEFLGIRVDGEKLQRTGEDLSASMNALEREIYEAAGVEFNINSPKQLAEILFDKMGIKPVKKTKTGFSTDESVLTILSEKHALPAKVLAYRQLSKLKGTYVDGLISLIDPVTGRVHTSLNQTVTTTGRLSSSRPNLQNIPVRGEYAARIREAFVPEEGFEFLSADYSQIELRLVAHMSADPALVRAFNEGEDIHSATASEVFGVIPALVTPELRRRAKAINFGIIYGMGSYGLSAELGISAREAAEYIDGYFAHYGTVKEFIDETIRSATKLGYTTTLFGRKRFIPELKNPVEQTRRFGERMAVNTPIQGTAADMIKAAMIRIDADLRAGGFKSRMLLQIHDELLFEFLPDEKDALLSVVKSGMEGVITLKVPVIVNVKTGRDWSRVD